MRVSLRQIRAFIQVADTGSFVAAARSMHVTPAALSVVVRALETELGFELFERTTRRVDLSAAGQQYLPYARRVLQDLGHAEQAATDIRSGVVGIVRVSATQGLACAVLPQLFNAFQALHPGVRMVPVDTGIDGVTQAVERGDAEFAIAPHYEVVDTGVLDVMPLVRSRLHLVCRKDDALARLRAVAWPELRHRHLIYMGKDPGLQAATEPLFGKAEAPLLSVDHLTTALGLVASGAGLAVLTDYTAPLLRIHDLTMVPLVQPQVLRQVTLYRHRTRQLLPVAQGFERFLTGMGAEQRKAFFRPASPRASA